MAARAAIQQLDRLTKDFSKQARELSNELREEQGRNGRHHFAGMVGITLIALVAFISGILFTRFFL